MTWRYEYDDVIMLFSFPEFWSPSQKQKWDENGNIPLFVFTNPDMNFMSVI